MFRPVLMTAGKTLTTLALALATKAEKPADGFSNATLLGGRWSSFSLSPG